MLRVKCDRGEVCCHQHVGTESAERPLAHLETVLGLAVLHQVDVSCVGVGEPELPGRIVLVIPGLQQQRVVAVTAEAYVGEPWPAAVGQAHDGAR